MEDFSSALFEQSKVSFDDFVIQIESNPNLLTDPSLVIKIGDTYHKWDTAAPIIMSHVLYGRSLPLDLMEKLKEKSTFKRGKICTFVDWCQMGFELLIYSSSHKIAGRHDYFCELFTFQNTTQLI